MKKQQKKKLLPTSKEVAATETNKQETKQDVAADSRRSFLRNGLLAAAGFYIVPRNVLGRGFTAPSDKLQIAGMVLAVKVKAIYTISLCLEKQIS